jgi:hypothetical protein
MRVVHVSLLFCVAAVLLCPVVYAGPSGDGSGRLMREYPISVKVQQVSEDVQRSVVFVLIRWASCHNPKAVPLNEFMDKYVPEALRTTGCLPQALDCATQVNEGVVDLDAKVGKHLEIKDQGHLPVWLEVSVGKKQDQALNEDENERFAGDISNSWAVSSCFVTRFCAKAEITKFHEETAFEYVKPVVLTGKRSVFRWVDP